MYEIRFSAFFDYQRLATHFACRGLNWASGEMEKQPPETGEMK
jgi:hypothetical protein